MPALQRIDETAIHFFKKISDPLSRWALFIIYFWFGVLKVVAESPANPLVESLLERTLPFLTFDQFIVGLGIFEMVIGVAFLIRGWERFALILLLLHMFTTFMPLILLPSMTWGGFMVPTLEGQYIIKNLLIIALAFGIMGRLHPSHRIESQGTGI